MLRTIFIFLGIVFAVGCIVTFVISIYDANTKSKTLKAPVAAELTATQFLADFKQGKNHTGKYILLTGDLIGIDAMIKDQHRTISITTGQQTDSCYLVGHPLLEVQDSNETCNKKILSYRKRYRMRESSQKILFSGDIHNDIEDSLILQRHFPSCAYEDEKFRFKYRLQNFCLERVTVKALVGKINTTGAFPVVELEDLVIVSKQDNPKMGFR